MPSSVRIVGTRDLGNLMRDLRQTADGRETMKQLKKGLREAGKPVIPIIRADIMAIPSKEQNKARGKKSLRTEMQRAVTLQVKLSGNRAGVFIYMNPRKMPDGKKSLPGYMEGAKKYERWRHRVYGRNIWVQQDARPYMTWAVTPLEQNMRRNMQRLIEDVAKKVENS